MKCAGLAEVGGKCIREYLHAHTYTCRGPRLCDTHFGHLCLDPFSLQRLNRSLRAHRRLKVYKPVTCNRPTYDHNSPLCSSWHTICWVNKFTESPIAQQYWGGGWKKGCICINSFQRKLSSKMFLKLPKTLCFDLTVTNLIRNNYRSKPIHCISHHFLT